MFISASNLGFRMLKCRFFQFVETGENFTEESLKDGTNMKLNWEHTLQMVWYCGDAKTKISCRTILL